MEIHKKNHLEMLRWLHLIRETELRIVEYHKHSPLPELPHSSLGQEAISVGCVYPLRQDDQILPSLRTRGAFLVKGISSRTMMAGAFGKVTGAAHGKNTSHHMGDPKCGVIAGTGIVAGHVPVGLGTALVAKLQKKDFVSVCFYGDGAANRGDVHESLNMASVFDLPYIFVCENNQYAISSPAGFHTRVDNIAERAKGYGIPGIVVDGNDVIAVYDVMCEAIDRARGGKGPTLIECKTYRWKNHSERDPRDLRPKEEIKDWIENKDPLKKYISYLLGHNILSLEEISSIEKSVREEVDDAISFAENSSFPDPEDALTNVYAEAK